MGRFLTLYRDCGKDNCTENIYHVEREVCWLFNERGLCTWVQDNYKFHFGKEPEPSFYDVTSHHDGENASIYTRKQLFDNILYYWNRLHPKLRSGQCYFFPYYRYSTADCYTVTVSGEKIPMKENDIEYYEKWLKQVVSFSQQYLLDQDLLLSVSD